MTNAWSELLQRLSGDAEQLAVQSAKLLSGFPDHSVESQSFYIDRTPKSKYLASSRFSWKKHFAIEGRTCVYQLPTLFNGLLYYDTLIVPLAPVPQKLFNSSHPFSLQDTDRVAKLSRDGRLILALTDHPSRFRTCGYMQRLFEQANPQCVSWVPNRIMAQDPECLEYEERADKLTEAPAIKAALIAAAKATGESFKTTEGAVISALLDLRFQGYEELSEAAWQLLVQSPAVGIEFVFAVRHLVLDPVDYAAGIPHSWERRALQAKFSYLRPSMGVANISVPYESGSVLETKLAFPTPRSWEGLQWCDDHLDTKGIREAFGILEEEVTASLSTGAFTEDSGIQDRLRSCWDQQQAEAQRLVSLMNWGAQLSIGAAGTLVGGPILGLLSSLGLTALTNVYAMPFSKHATKLLRRNAFHIWELNARSGRNL